MRTKVYFEVEVVCDFDCKNCVSKDCIFREEKKEKK